MEKKRRFWQRRRSSTQKRNWDWLKKVFAWGFVGCLLGIVTVLTVAYIEVVIHPETRLAKVAIEVGVAAEFSTEAEMGCGFGVCLGCVIPGTEKPFLVSCTEGPILAPEKIAWERA